MESQADYLKRTIAEHGDSMECLLWPFGHVMGYGRVHYKGSPWFAHRLAYALTHGSVPDDAVVMHSCDRRSCYSPNHLSLGSHAENLADRDHKRRLYGRGYARTRNPPPAPVLPVSRYSSLRKSPTRSVRAVAALIDEHAGSNECLLWPFKRNGFGYGIVLVNGKQERVHRIAYELAHGSIPKGKLVMHACDTPACFNPLHLSVGTNAENNRDRVLRGRDGSLHGEQHRRSLFTDRQVMALRWLNANGAGGTTIARRLGVSTAGMQSMLRGRTWKHIAQTNPDGESLARSIYPNLLDLLTVNRAVMFREILRRLAAGESGMSIVRTLGVNQSRVTFTKHGVIPQKILAVLRADGAHDGCAPAPM